MNLDTEMGNMEIAPIQFISAKMETLQVPDNTFVCNYLKDGKLFFNEPKLRAESHLAVAEKIIYYRKHRAKLEAGGNLTQQSVEVPPEFLDLIAALVQDSEEPFTTLSTRIDDLLSPFLRSEADAHKFEYAIEKAIKKVAQKVNYGLTEEVYAKIEHTAPKIPWHLYIGRWEVKDINMFPPDMQQVVILRRQNRKYMTDVFTTFIQSLPPAERSTIVNTKHRKNPSTHKDPEETRYRQQADSEEEKRKKREEEKKKNEEKKILDEKKALEDEKRRQREEEKRKQREEEKRVKDEEKRVREEEKKKREGEKKKKEQSQLRLTSLFAKTTVVETAPYVEKLLEPVNPTLFPAFYIKDNVTIVDKHHCALPPSTESDYIQFKNSIDQSKSVPKSTAKRNFVDQLSPDTRQRRGLSTHLDIRTLLLPGSADILRVPNVRQILRMKLLHFSENVRPAYYGTFTQRSNRVSGRRPFIHDDKLDYDIDSEAEWEPEGEGEDIVSGDEDEDDPNADMIDPEDAGWLVPEGYLSDNEGVEGEDEDDRGIAKASTLSTNKRIAVRKIVLGPFFEGNDHDDLLKPFETNFFVDTSEEGYNPFYKEPVARAPTITPSTVAPTTANNTTQVKTTHFTDERTNALINVINEKSLDSIPSLITEAKSNHLLKDVSKRQLEAKIKNIAVKEKRGSDTKPTWYLKAPTSQNES